MPSEPQGSQRSIIHPSRQHVTARSSDSAILHMTQSHAIYEERPRRHSDTSDRASASAGAPSLFKMAPVDVLHLPSTVRNSTHTSEHEIQVAQRSSSAPRSAAAEAEPTAVHAASDRSTADVVTAAQEVFKTQGKAFRLVDKALRARHRLDRELQHLLNCVRFVMESARELQEAVVKAAPSGKSEDFAGTLEIVAERFGNDYTALTQQEHSTRTHQDEVSNLEYHLVSQEKDLNRSIQNLFSALGDDGTALDLARSLDSDPLGTPSETPSLLEQYYCRKGEINIQLERLQNLTDDFLEDLGDRNFRADHDQDLSPSNEEFARSYEQNRLQILTELEAAREDSARLYEACKDAGIEIEDEGNADDSERSILDSKTPGINAPPQPRVPEQSTHSVASPTPGDLHGPTRPSVHEAPALPEDAQSNVHNWLAKIPAGPWFSEQAVKIESPTTQAGEATGSQARLRRNSYSAYESSKTRPYAQPLMAFEAGFSSSLDPTQPNLFVQPVALPSPPSMLHTLQHSSSPNPYNATLDDFSKETGSHIQATNEDYQRPGKTGSFITGPSQYKEPSKSSSGTSTQSDAPSIQSSPWEQRSISLSSWSQQTSRYPAEEKVEGDFISRHDPKTLVWTRIQISPPDAITDPDLYHMGIRAHRKLLGASADQGEIYANKPFADFTFPARPREFFAVGRVFVILWVASPMDSTSQVTSVTMSKSASGSGEVVYSRVRRFVVIRECQNYCSALPILTYGRQGVSKPGVNKAEHAIIYSSRNVPRPTDAEQPVRGEAGMRVDPIRVKADDRMEKLDPMSRIDFAKVYTISHDIRVRPFGMVHERSMGLLRRHFYEVFDISSVS